MSLQHPEGGQGLRVTLGQGQRRGWGTRPGYQSARNMKHLWNTLEIRCPSGHVSSHYGWDANRFRYCQNRNYPQVETPAASTRADLALGKGLPPASLSCTIQPEPPDVPPDHHCKAKCEEMKFWNQGMQEAVLFPGGSFFYLHVVSKNILKLSGL